MREKKNVSDSRLLLTLQEMVLIKKSYEPQKIDVYGNMFDCLEKYNKLSKVELERNLAFDDKARVVLINIDNKKKMMSNVLSEWYSVKDFDISDIRVNCQLCGRPNKYIFYIRNKLTDIELHVGSDCVTKFSDITGIKQQKRKLSQVVKEQERQKNKIKFEICEGEDVGFLDEAGLKLKNFKVMLPFKLHNSLKETLIQLNLVKNCFIKNGGDIDTVYCEFTKLKSNFDILYNKAIVHYNNVKNLTLVCDRDTEDWILNNNSFLWEKVAKNNGLFETETLRDISYGNYISQKLPEITTHLNDKDIKVLDLNGGFLRFLIRNRRYSYPITFTMTLKNFMNTIGCYCLTDFSYKFDRTALKEITIENSSKNYNALYNSISPILKAHGYDFLVENKTAQAYWKKLANYESMSRWSNRIAQVGATYKKSEISKFLNTLSPFLLQEESVLEDKFEIVIKKMECGQSWITQKEKDMSEAITREARGMQKQREFTPY